MFPPGRAQLMSWHPQENESSFCSDHEKDEDKRRHRNRERNKEHARKTRVRKKEQLQGLKSTVRELEEEGRNLKQQIQECSVASILLGLSAGAPGEGDQDETLSANSSTPSSPQSNFGACLAGGKRKRFLSLDGEDPTPPPMELNIKGQITLVGGPGNEGKTQINWKTGVYVDDTGKRQQLTKTELESLRRERNRMHAKMTRDRKKCFIASLKRVISRLEDENEQLRETLDKSRADERALASEDSQHMAVYSSSFSTSISQLEDENEQLRETLKKSIDEKALASEESNHRVMDPSSFSTSINQTNTSSSMFSSNIYTVG